MIRVLKPRVSLYCVFPHFLVKRRLPSPKIGFSNKQHAKNKLKEGRVFDALVSLFQTRLLIPLKFNQLNNNLGSFMVNLSPVCFELSPFMVWPDADAVYISSKNEVILWEKQQSIDFHFPFGTSGFYSAHACIEIIKTS